MAKIIRKSLMKSPERFVFLSTLTLIIIIIATDTHAEILRGSVTSVQGKVIELSIGAEKGIRVGDSGRVYYHVTVEGKEQPIYIARFKVTRLSERSSTAQIEEKTTDLRKGLLVEITITLGELEVKSEPSGARVSVDGKEMGQTPLVLPGIRLGQHVIRIAKEEHYPYEEQIDLTGPERKRVFASLRKLAGELLVSTDPPGASIYIDGKSAGTSPYEGKTLSPGTCRVRIVKEGYETWERDVVIGVGKRVEVLAQLKAQEGGLEILSEPSGAKVYLDGKEMGQTPLSLPGLRVGQRQIRMVREGYEPYEGQIKVVEGERKKVLASLRKIVGVLSIRTEPSGASIFIDGKPVGTSPYESGDLAPGSYQVRIEKRGYTPWEGSLTVIAGKKVEVPYPIELKARVGHLEVLSEPPGAKVYVDGKEMGQTPLSLSDLRVGQRRIRVVMEGYEPYEEQVRIIEAKNRVTASLKRVRGDLSINTEPPRSDIYINEKPVGTSPYEGKDLQPGTYRVKVTRSGYEPWETDVTVKAGERNEVHVELREKRREVATAPPPSKPEAKRKEPPRVPEPPKAPESRKVPESPRVPESPKAGREVDWTNRSCEAPIWNVGDKWTYRKADKGLWTQEVVDVKEDAFIMKISGIENLLAYDKKTMNLNYSIGKNGRKFITSDDPFKRLFEFPLFVGKTWSYTTPWGSDKSCVNHFKVEGVEEVRTPAGKFVAYKIYCKGKVLAPVSSSSQSHESWARYWYSPEVKSWVKREYDQNRYWSKVNQDTEIISYKLK